MRVVVKRVLTHLCPFVDERDLGSIDATWEGSGVELHALASFLDGWADSKVTHEDLTARTLDWLGRNGARPPVAVRTRWETAGLAVEVVARDDG